MKKITKIMEVNWRTEIKKIKKNITKEKKLRQIKLKTRKDMMKERDKKNNRKRSKGIKETPNNIDVFIFCQNWRKIYEIDEISYVGNYPIFVNLIGIRFKVIGKIYTEDWRKLNSKFYKPFWNKKTEGIGR